MQLKGICDCESGKTRLFNLMGFDLGLFDEFHQNDNELCRFGILLVITLGFNRFCLRAF